jgi:phage terminase large subunit-like protein
VQTIPRMLKDRKLVHCSQPLVDWAVGNVKTVVRGSNTLIEKMGAGVTKIDPVIALLNASMLMLRDPEASGAAAGSYLDDAEMLVL